MHLTIVVMILLSFSALGQTRVRENVKQVDPTNQISEPVKAVPAAVKTPPAPAAQAKGRR